MLIKRTLSKIRTESLNIEKCVAVCGARQVGKTTLVRSIGEKINSVYYILDFPDIRGFLTENAYREFDKKKRKLIIIDENPGKRGQFLITGASQIYLQEDYSYFIYFLLLFRNWFKKIMIYYFLI